MALAFAALAHAASGESLVIMTNGECLVSSSVREEGANLRCRTASPTNDHIIRSSSVAHVLKSVEKGKTYTREDAENALKEIDAVGRRFPRLLRQLNAFRQDWTTVLHPDTGAGTRIAGLSARFDSGDKSPASFREIGLQLEMIRARDKQGMHAERIDAAIERMRAEFLRINQPRFTALVEATPPSVSNYVAARDFGDAMKQCPIPAQARKSVDESVARCLDATLNALCGEAVRRLSSAPTVDTYLAANENLTLLAKAAQANPVAGDAIAPWRRRVLEAAAKALPAHDFSFGGYPLTQEDRRLMNAGGGNACCATGRVEGIELDEQCCLIVTQQSRPSAAQGLKLSLRLVFNRPQPAGRQFGLAGQLRSGNVRSAPFVWKIPAVTIRNGRADVPFSSPFPKWSGTAPTPSSSELDLCVVCEQPGAGPADRQWIGLSAGFTIKPTE
jgi:hypothetical protein